MFLKWQVARCYKSHYALFFWNLSKNTHTNKSSVQKSPSWEAKRSSVNQKSPSSWPNSSLLCALRLTACPYCEAYKSSPRLPLIFIKYKFYYYYIPIYALVFQASPSIRLSHQNSVCTSFLSFVAHSPSTHHPQTDRFIIFGVKQKPCYLIIQFPPASCYLLAFRRHISV